MMGSKIRRQWTYSYSLSFADYCSSTTIHCGFLNVQSNAFSFCFHSNRCKNRPFLLRCIYSGKVLQTQRFSITQGTDLQVSSTLSQAWHYACCRRLRRFIIVYLIGCLFSSGDGKGEGEGHKRTQSNASEEEVGLYFSYVPIRVHVYCVYVINWTVYRNTITDRRVEGIKRNRYQDGGRPLYKEMYKVSTGQTTVAAATAADNTFQIVLRARVLNKYASLVHWKNLYCC